MDVPVISVLILSYNALPMDVVSSYRAKAYCDHFAALGIKPTLLTHRWEMAGDRFVVHNSADKVVYEETENCEFIRLPYPGATRSRSSIGTLLSYMRGNIDVELMPSYKVFRRFLWQHLRQKRYDFLIAIYNPHFQLKLAYEIHNTFNIPYVLDFRDLWDNDIVTGSYCPGLKKKIINRIIAAWWRKWIHSSLFFAAVSDQWKAFLSGLSRKDGIVVRNGFDNLMISKARARHTRTSPFKVVHFGRLYVGQNLEIFLEGFKRFAVAYSPMEVTFELIGLKKVAGIDFKKKIEDSLGEYVNFRPYISRDELMNYCKEHATLFFFPDFTDDNGSFAVKVYDYLAMGTNILVAPGGGEVSRLVLDLDAGVVANDSRAVSAYLDRCYQEYKRNGYLTCQLNREKLKAYSREKQVKVMADHVRRFASN